MDKNSDNNIERKTPRKTIGKIEGDRIVGEEVERMLNYTWNRSRRRPNSTVSPKYFAN